MQLQRRLHAFKRWLRWRWGMSCHLIGMSVALICGCGFTCELIRFHSTGLWLPLLRERGHIQQLIGVIQELDTAWDSAATSEGVRTAPPGALSIYDAAMSLLIQISHSPAGAQALIDYGAVPTLSRCHTLLRRPIGSIRLAEGVTLGEELARFRQLLFPVLNLLLSLCTTRPDDERVASEVLGWISSFSKLVAWLLKDRDHELSISRLHEVCVYVIALGIE
jgi:hypothetical protein